MATAVVECARRELVAVAVDVMGEVVVEDLRECLSHPYLRQRNRLGYERQPMIQHSTEE